MCLSSVSALPLLSLYPVLFHPGLASKAGKTGNELPAEPGGFAVTATEEALPG